MGDRFLQLFGAASLAGSVVCAAANAQAQAGVLSTPPNSAEIREVRVAVAPGPAQSTVWFGARLVGAPDALFVVIPVAPGGAVDAVSDAWFESLEAATFPRVFPPDQPVPDPCPGAVPPSAAALDAVGDASHVQSVDPVGVPVVSTLAELVVWAQSEGLDLSFDEVSTLADLDVAGFRFLSVRFEMPAGEEVLRAVRVTAPSALTRVPLLLTRAGGERIRTTVWIVSEGRAVPTGLPWTTIDSSALSWSLHAAQPPTNYRALWDKAMDGAQGALWVVESAAHATLFRRASFPEGIGSAPSIAEAYLERASSYGDALASYTPCVAKIAALETTQSTVGTACAPGALGALAPLPGEPPCTELPVSGQTDPDDLRCGDHADDLALALAGKVPSRVWVTRWTGEIRAWSARPAESLAIAQGAGVSQILRCAQWDAEGCKPDGGTTPGTGGSSTSTPANTGGGTAPGPSSPSSPPGYYDDEYYDDDHDALYVEGSCWGDSSSSSSAYDESEEESCAGDSSSSSEEEDSCSGDTSDAAGDEDESCAGDSSSSDSDDSCSGDSSSAESEDSCAGDSSSDSSSSESCDSGGSSSSSGGDSCSGGSTGSSNSSDCAVRGMKKRGRGGRIPVSAFSLLLVASYLVVRRMRREQERRWPFE